jgi:flagellar M-ring protein FliF
MDFKELLTQLSKAFLRLEKNQKIIISASLLAVVGFFVFLIILSTAEDKSYTYKPLFESVPYTEAREITEALKKNNIDYSIEEKGNSGMATIKVANEDMPEARMQVASLGLPKDNRVGFELFNEQEFGATDFDQKIKYLRAIEGELSKTIEMLEPVQGAKVHIALPQDSLFVARQVKPTASVVLTLQESMILLPKQVKGIKHLVASSIPKLSPDDVTIVNAFGEPLGDNDDMTASSEEAKIQMTYKNRYEKQYENKIVEVLAPFIGGTDRVVAKVTIEFDFSKEESQKEYYDPESVVRSEQSVDELREGSTPQDIGGVPGAVSNIGAVQGIGDNNKEKYEKSKATTNYEISKTVSSKKAEFSRITRVTAAVVVDGSYREKVDENGKNTGGYEYVPLSDDELKSVENLVIRAIGINLNRGDEVSVRNFQFKSIKDLLNRKIVLNTWTDKIAQYVPINTAIQYLVAALILFFFYRQVIRPFAIRMLEEVKEDDEPVELELDRGDELEEDLSEKYSAMRKNVEMSLGLNETLNEDQVKYDLLVEEVTKYISEHTDEVSNLIQLLIEEESSAGTPQNPEEKGMPRGR